MKRTLTGGFLSLIGSIWSTAIVTIAGNNLVSSWDTEVGRLWTTMNQLDLTPSFTISMVVTGVGIVLMMVELFRKEK